MAKATDAEIRAFQRGKDAGRAEAISELRSLLGLSPQDIRDVVLEEMDKQESSRPTSAYP
jgi:hypothetical protein